jgi:NAD(P)-dependent dehydrogenase (short-subunit alcohol dehydrogenase family)
VLIDLRPDRVEAGLARLQRRDERVSGWTCDVADREQVARTFAAIGDRYGRIDVLANVAGRSMLVPFVEMSDEDIDWVLGPNLLGALWCARAAIPRMPPGARIVNVTSVSGRVPTPGEAFYSACKAAVVSLSESLDAELHSRGIGVTVVLPGEMSTGLFAEHPSWERRPEWQRRMEVQPSRMAEVICKALSRDRHVVVYPMSMRASLIAQQLAPGPFRWGVARYWRRLAPRVSGAGRNGEVSGSR